MTTITAFKMVISRMCAVPLFEESILTLITTFQRILKLKYQRLNSSSLCRLIRLSYCVLAFSFVTTADIISEFFVQVSVLVNLLRPLCCTKLVFVTFNHFRLSLLFAGKARNLPLTTLRAFVRIGSNLAWKYYTQYK